jgi:hypothetical protein
VEARARQLIGIEEWVARSQPCGYIVAHDVAADAREVQVFTDCTDLDADQR